MSHSFDEEIRGGENTHEYAHEYAHEHSHEHLHEHCSGHSHDHEAAEQMSAGMFVLSKVRQFDGPIEAAVLQKKLRSLFLNLTKKAIVEGLIPGHLKGVARAAGGETLGISVTRPGVVDFAPSAAWEQMKVLEQYTLTVNVMLLAESNIQEEDLFSGLAQHGKD